MTNQITGQFKTKHFQKPITIIFKFKNPYLKWHVRYSDGKIVGPQRIPPIKMFLQQDWHLQRKREYSNSHRCIHQEQHIKKEKSEVRENFVSVVSNLPV